ncbi:MAG: hypothetical protein QXN34_06930 [Archaeoglobaceae archaeon]
MQSKERREMSRKNIVDYLKRLLEMKRDDYLPVSRKIVEKIIHYLLIDIEEKKAKKRRMFTTEELKYAAQILNFFAPPPVCVCESRNFKFCINENELHAFCINCGKHYEYNPKNRVWGQKPDLHFIESSLIIGEERGDF